MFLIFLHKITMFVHIDWRFAYVQDLQIVYVLFYMKY